MYSLFRALTEMEATSDLEWKYSKSLEYISKKQNHTQSTSECSLYPNKESWPKMDTSSSAHTPPRTEDYHGVIIESKSVPQPSS